MPRYLILLLAPLLLAADGDVVSTIDWRSVERMRVVRLCDGDHSATDCAELDLQDADYGLPRYMVASLTRTTDCSGAPSVTVRGLVDAAGAAVEYAALTTAGTSAVVVNPLRHRFVDGTVTGGTDCTDLEVQLRLFY